MICEDKVATFGNHTCVWSVEKHLTTYDNGVVAILEQKCISRPNDERPIFVKLEYVRWVEDGELTIVFLFFVIRSKQTMLGVLQC